MRMTHHNPPMVSVHHHQEDPSRVSGPPWTSNWSTFSHRDQRSTPKPVCNLGIRIIHPSSKGYTPAPTHPLNLKNYNIYNDKSQQRSTHTLQHNGECTASACPLTSPSVTRVVPVCRRPTQRTGDEGSHPPRILELLNNPEQGTSKWKHAQPRECAACAGMLTAWWFEHRSFNFALGIWVPAELDNPKYVLNKLPLNIIELTNQIA